MTTPVAVAVYARISADHDGTALGVTRQLDDCHQLAARLGWTVAEDYVDNDLSAYSGKRRPRFTQMLEDITDGLRDGVIVYHVDRLTRRPIELEQFLGTVTAAKVQHIRFVTGIDGNIADGDSLLMLRIVNAVGANESDTKSRRVRRKLDEVAASGKPHGGSRRPYGFEDDRISHRPEEAAIIRTLADRFIAGESLRSLCVWLGEHDIRTVFGKPWRTTTLRDVLTSGRIAGLRRHRNAIIGPGNWEPIITATQRERILALLEQRRTTGQRSPRSYLLTGLLRCGKCASTLYASRREHSRRYVCVAGPDHHGCGRLTIVAEPVEQLLADAVLYRLDTPELAAALAGINSADQHTAALSDALASDRQQMDDLAAMWANHEITRPEWIAARQPIEGRIKDTERRLARLTRTSTLSDLVGNGIALRDQWASLNLTRQHAIVKAVLDFATIASANGRNTFDPDRVHPSWKV